MSYNIKFDNGKSPRDANSEEYIARIKNHFGYFSEAERKVASYIMEEKTAILNLSVQELSKRTATSPATIIRFCNTIGFRGYTELKFYIERSILSMSGENNHINKKDSINVIKQKLFNGHKSIIDDTFMVLNDAELEKAIDALSRAKKIQIYGEGSSGSIAGTAFNLFTNLGLNCNVHTDAFAQVATAANLSKNDVALGIAHSGRIINTIDALKVAKKSGSTTICITGYVDSPITDVSDIVLYCSAASSSNLSDWPSARISELSVIAVLQAGIMVKNYEKTSESMRNAREAFELKRVKL